MNKELFIRNNITVNANAAILWDVLTNPEQTKKYMFGCETVSDWKVGSELLWRAEYEGKQMVFVKGYIVQLQLKQLLIYTVIDPNNTSIPDVPENYLTVTYTLEEENDTTHFTVIQGDYSKVAEGEKRYHESYNNGEGWNPILVQIKKLAEENH
jgi:uncharacterized protein YndB with AHSA1/START domain